MDQRISTDVVNHRSGDYAPIGDQEDPKLGMFDKPLPCFGWEIGWFSLLLGFVFPVMWYHATFLYFAKYYKKDPRERTGLEASAVAVKWGNSEFLLGRVVMSKNNATNRSAYKLNCVWISVLHLAFLILCYFLLMKCFGLQCFGWFWSV